MKDIIIENAKLIFKNFSGAPGRYNPQGNRNFNVILDPQMAQIMHDDGWNVKTLAPRMDGDEPLYILPVAVSYRLYPPKIVLVNSKGKTVMDESELSIFDFAEFTNIDLCINPSRYDFQGRTGIKAYLKSMYATIYEDELEQKYRDVPDSAINSIMPNEV